MSISISGSNSRDWAAYGLKDYSDFSECTTDINQRDIGDCTEGEWFYIDDDLHIVEEQGTFRVIYHGTWGNYNSPGASHYTHADLYDINDPDDMAEFEDYKASLEAADEWLESDGDDM